jgi:hypothetical protein
MRHADKLIGLPVSPLHPFGPSLLHFFTSVIAHYFDYPEHNLGVNAKPKSEVSSDRNHGQAIAVPHNRPHPPPHEPPFSAFMALGFFAFFAPFFEGKQFIFSRLEGKIRFFYFFFSYPKTKDLAARTSKTKELHARKVVKKRQKTAVLAKNRGFQSKTAIFRRKKNRAVSP